MKTKRIQVSFYIFGLSIGTRYGILEDFFFFFLPFCGILAIENPQKTLHKSLFQISNFLFPVKNLAS
jgi:hypothetical protein